jgi:hypothetical protein
LAQGDGSPAGLREAAAGFTEDCLGISKPNMSGHFEAEQVLGAVTAAAG